MQKTCFTVSKMDCPSEEQLIRMKLDGLEGIHSLKFDIPGRKLTVYHTAETENILTRLEELNLDTTLESSLIAEDHISDSQIDQRKLLWQVLLINFFFFALEMLAGFMAKSMGLVADSLDMLADSIVYGLALMAVGSTLNSKKKVARISGYFQLCLALLGLAEVIRRFLGIETVPSFQVMIIVSILALFGNIISLHLLQKSKSKEAHMQASMIFTSNDVIVNLGVIVAGILVFVTTSNYPDLIIGTLVFILVGRGALRILKLAK